MIFVGVRLSFSFVIFSKLVIFIFQLKVAVFDEGRRGIDKQNLIAAKQFLIKEEHNALKCQEGSLTNDIITVKLEDVVHPVFLTHNCIQAKCKIQSDFTTSFVERKERCMLKRLCSHNVNVNRYFINSFKSKCSLKYK